MRASPGAVRLLICASYLLRAGRADPFLAPSIFAVKINPDPADYTPLMCVPPTLQHTALYVDPLTVQLCRKRDTADWAATRRKSPLPQDFARSEAEDTQSWDWYTSPWLPMSYPFTQANSCPGSMTSLRVLQAERQRRRLPVTPEEPVSA